MNISDIYQSDYSDDIRSMVLDEIFEFQSMKEIEPVNDVTL